MFGQCEVEQAGGSSLIQRQQHSAGLKLGQRLFSPVHLLTGPVLQSALNYSPREELDPGWEACRGGVGVWTGKGDGQGEQGRPRTDPSQSGAARSTPRCGPQERDTGRWQPVTLWHPPPRRMLHDTSATEGKWHEATARLLTQKAGPAPSSRFPVPSALGRQMTRTLRERKPWRGCELQHPGRNL